MKKIVLEQVWAEHDTSSNFSAKFSHFEDQLAILSQNQQKIANAIVELADMIDNSDKASRERDKIARIWTSAHMYGTFEEFEKWYNQFKDSI